MKSECPECGWSKEVADSAEGKKGRCPECDTVFRICSPAVEKETGEDNGKQEKGVDQKVILGLFIVFLGVVGGLGGGLVAGVVAMLVGGIVSGFILRTEDTSDYGESKWLADKVLQQFAWINMWIMIIEGIVLGLVVGEHWGDKEGVAAGVSMIWSALLVTSFLLTIAQIARQLRRDSQNTEEPD